MPARAGPKNCGQSAAETETDNAKEIKTERMRKSITHNDPPPAMQDEKFPRLLPCAAKHRTIASPPLERRRTSMGLPLRPKRLDEGIGAVVVHF